MQALAPSAIGSRAVLACRDTLVAVLAVRIAGCAPVAPGEADGLVNHAALPPGVTAREWTGHNRLAMPIEAPHLPALHDLAVGMAWAQGAWDIAVDLIPPLEGVGLGLVTANTDWTACDPRARALLLAAGEAGRLAYWSWRPLADGPDHRRRRHAPKDATLTPDAARAGPPPGDLAAPDWTWRAYRGWLIRLGRWSPAHEPPRPRPRRLRATPRATARQRAYIVALRRRTGRDLGAPLPADLTVRQASAMIDVLLGAAVSEGG